jgi:hypothetical protein
MLSETALEVLRQYWKEYKPKKWLFGGARGETVTLKILKYIG